MFGRDRLPASLVSDGCYWGLHCHRHHHKQTITAIRVVWRFYRWDVKDRKEEMRGTLRGKKCRVIFSKLRARSSSSLSCSTPHLSISFQLLTLTSATFCKISFCLFAAAAAVRTIGLMHSYLDLIFYNFQIIAARRRRRKRTLKSWTAGEKEGRNPVLLLLKLPQEVQFKKSSVPRYIYIYIYIWGGAQIKNRPFDVQLQLSIFLRKLASS